MRLFLRGVLGGCCSLGLAISTGCGAPSDDVRTELAASGSAASAPRLLDGVAASNGESHPLAPAWMSDAGVLPTAARSPSQRGYVVQPAAPLAEQVASQPTPPVVPAPPLQHELERAVVRPMTPAGEQVASKPAAPVAPTPDVRPDLAVVDVEDIETPPAPREDAPLPESVLGGLFTSPGGASPDASRRHVPNAPLGWPLESRLSDARGQYDPSHAPSPVVVAAPSPATPPAARVALPGALSGPIPQSEFAAQVPIELGDIESAPDARPSDASAAGPLPTPASREPGVDVLPGDDRIEEHSTEVGTLAPAPADAEPLRPVLLTPECEQPDSHWPSTVVPLPPVEGASPFAPESAPLPDRTTLPPAPLAEPAPTATVESAEGESVEEQRPARELQLAERGRPAPVEGPTRSAEMEAVSRLAYTHVQSGFALAQRSALFAARSEFIQALRILAQAKDTEQHTRCHSQALAAGLRAIEEADDLTLSGSHLEADIDLEVVITGHRTSVLHGADLESMTVTVALQRYFTHAQEQLAAAAPEEPVASMALYGLGKVHATLARHPSTNVKAPEPKAMVFHQAALLVDRRNYLAANDLGVVLVRLGRLSDAREAFLFSLSQQPQIHVWNNLAAVHRRLGETVLAGQAQQEAHALATLGAEHVELPVQAPEAVRWVTPGEFAGVTQTAQRPDVAAPQQPPVQQPATSTGAERPLLERILPSRESQRK